MNIGIDSKPDSDLEKRKAIFKVQSEVMRCARKFLEAEGFLEVLSPVFESFTDTGIGDAEFFEIDTLQIVLEQQGFPVSSRNAR